MKLTVLGCSGGIGGPASRTSSFLVDEDILIDCGTGVGDLDLDVLRGVGHVFLTHAHMDHIASLPLMVDAVGEDRRFPLTVYGTPETVRILRAHIFNWLVWPDFTAIPSRSRPLLRFQTIKAGETVRLGARVVTALPAHHTVPAVGYCLDSGAGQLVYTGDTTYSKALVQAVNACTRLRHLIVEAAFPDELHGLALASRHLSPKLLGILLDELTVSPQVHICHLKPGFGGRILAQVDEYPGRLHACALEQGQVLMF